MTAYFRRRRGEYTVCKLSELCPILRFELPVSPPKHLRKRLSHLQLKPNQFSLPTPLKN